MEITLEIGVRTVGWMAMAEWKLLADASLELVTTVVTWRSRSRFGSI